jgi:hypothetical protein
MSSLLYCVGLLFGSSCLAVLHWTTSSAEQLRGSTALLRANSRSLLRPFAMVGAACFVYRGAAWGADLGLNNCASYANSKSRASR